MQFAIEIDQVSHRYGKQVALDTVSLSLPLGRTIGLVGPDGVGKSTLLALLSGIKKLQCGRMTVLGGDVADRAFRRELAPRVAYMPQGLGRNLYRSLSVYDNIIFQRGCSGCRRPNVTRASSACCAPPGWGRFRIDRRASSRAA